METLVIQVPEKKSALVKQILKDLGVAVQMKHKTREIISAHHFVGLLSKKDATSMDDAIEEGCEKVNPNDWK